MKLDLIPEAITQENINDGTKMHFLLKSVHAVVRPDIGTIHYFNDLALAYKYHNEHPSSVLQVSITYEMEQSNNETQAG